jgi:hypothetical protein
MIQRLQTILFFISSLLFISLFFVPVATCTDVTIPYFEDNKLLVFDITLLTILTSAGAFFSLGNILLYNNRPLQIRISNFISLIAFGFLLVLFYIVMVKGENLMHHTEFRFTIGMFIPFVIAMLAWWASRLIARDERKVNSMNRLR